MSPTPENAATDAILDPVLAEIDASLSESTARLFELLRIPSISTDPAHAEDCIDAADWLVADLESLGAEASMRETPGHPMVMGRIEKASDSAKHILFYGHYDVQPVDPLDLWDNPPFEPRMEMSDAGPVIRARGSSDDKGQLMTFVEACRAWIAVHGALPAGITFFFEGEEESGSPSLVPFMEAQKDELAADVSLICDTGLLGHDTPTIVSQLRGLMGEQITIHAANKDLHSGMFGGAAANPARILAKLIAGLHDENGAVTLPGFYDGVEDLSPELAAQWAGLDFDPAAFLGDVGLSVPSGEKGRSVLEMLWSRPTLEVNGISGGYTGAGFKTVLPAKAFAKVSCRLVPGQDPDKIRAALRAYVNANIPADCTASFTPHGSGPANVMNITSDDFALARQALSDEWPREAAFVGCGGSIPIAGYFQSILGSEPLLIGFGKDDDQLHSPNEKYDLRSFHKGIRSWARILHALTKG